MPYPAICRPAPPGPPAYTHKSLWKTWREAFMEFKSVGSIYDYLRDAVRTTRTGVEVVDEELIRGECIDVLVYNSVFNGVAAVWGEARRTKLLELGSLGGWAA